MLKSIVLLFASGLMITNASAQTQQIQGLSGLPAALEHQRIARMYLEQKKYSQARDEAKLSTKAAPTDETNRDAWLILAGTEERLDNLPAAKDAYAKYLSLSPAPAKRSVVQDRLTDLEVKVDRFLRYKWGSRSAGLLLGYSPVFNSQTKEQMTGDMASSMDLGFKIGSMSFGYKKAVGKAGLFRAPTTTAANPPYGNVAAGARHVIEEVYFQFDIELTKEPERSPVVWSIPIYMAGVANGIRTQTSPEKLYISWGYDLASGISVSLYTKNAFSFDVTALYHVGIPFSEMQSNDDKAPAKTTAGEILSGASTGAEVRAGIKILFGTEPPKEN